MKPKYFPSKRNTKRPVAYIIIIFFYLFVNANVPLATWGMLKTKLQYTPLDKPTVRRTTSSKDSALFQREMYFFQYAIQY